MQFDSFSDFLAMGGYALFVWLSYGFGFTVFFLMWLISAREDKVQKQRLAAFYAREKQQASRGGEQHEGP